MCGLDALYHKAGLWVRAFVGDTTQLLHVNHSRSYPDNSKIYHGPPGALHQKYSLELNYCFGIFRVIVFNNSKFFGAVKHFFFISLGTEPRTYLVPQWSAVE